MSLQMAQGRSAYRFITSFVEAVQSKGRLTFPLHEVASETGASPQALKAALWRHMKSGAIRRVTPKADFFIIVPPECRSLGVPPVEWWISDLMTHLHRDYYLGLLSAAEAHGSAHFAVMETQVVTTAWMRPIHIGHTRIRFFQKANAGGVPVDRRQNPWGEIRVSGPEVTILDLLRYGACGVERTGMILDDLIKAFRKTRLVKALETEAETVAAQRLGYMLEKKGRRDLAIPIHGWLARRRRRHIDLERGGPRPWARDAKWRININFEAGDQS